MGRVTSVQDSLHAPVRLPADGSPAIVYTETRSVRTRSVSDLPLKILVWVDVHRRALFVGLFLFYLLSFNAQWRLDPDSALYLTVGRNIARGAGYTYHGQPHRLAYPGLPWLFAGLFRLFHTENLLPALIVMPLIGAAALALTYRLFLLRIGRPTAVMVTVALGICRTFYRYSFELMTDIPFLMGMMAFLVGVEWLLRGIGDDHRWSDFAPTVADAIDPGPRGKSHPLDAFLLIAGLAVCVITRPTMWAVLASVVVAAMWTVVRPPWRWERVLASLLVVAMVLITGFCFYHYARKGPADSAGAYEEAMLNRFTTRSGSFVQTALTKNLPELVQPNASESLFGIDIGSIDISRFAPPGTKLPVALPVSIAVLLSGLLLFRARPLWGILVVVTSLMMLATVVHVRYFLQVLPLMVFGWWLGMLWVRRRFPWPKYADAVFMLLGISFLMTNVIRSIGFIIEQRPVPFLAHYAKGRFASAEMIARKLSAEVAPGEWVLTRRKMGRILSNLSDRWVTEPDEATSLDPRKQRVYTLEPMDADGLKWMAVYDLAVGDPVGTPLVDAAGQSWQLHETVVVDHNAAVEPKVAGRP